MQNIGGRSNAAAAAAVAPTTNTTAKARGTKKKRSSFAAVTTTNHPSSSSFKLGGRRKSVPDEWDPMGCNFRVDRTRAIYQKTEITMPEIHHGIATSSMPIPLNTIMKTWNNVPKLHQYQPSELQVVYHRRTGETETLVKPEPVKPPDFKAFTHIIPSPLSTPDSNSSFIQTNTTKVLEFQRTTINEDSSKSEIILLQNNHSTGCEEPISSTPQLYNNAQQQQYQIFTTIESQTPQQIASTTSNSSSSSCQTEIQVKSVECQVNYQQQGLSTNRTNDCETQTSQIISGSAINKNIPTTLMGNCSNMQHHICRASQTETEPLKLLLSSNHSSQSTSIFTQTEPEPKKKEIVVNTKAVGTEKVSLNETAVQVNFYPVLPSKEECGCQTEIDIETPQICLMCDFKQLEITELEENMTELQGRFKRMQMQVEFLTTKEQQQQQQQTKSIVNERPNTIVQHSDASTNTEEEELVISPIIIPEADIPVPLPPTDNKYLELEIENDQLKATIQTLKMQLNSFQCGLKRLRAAIEKPIIDDSNIVSDEAIQQVMHKADDFILNSSNSQTRALKINDHLSVLNTCVSVANGIMNETPIPSPTK